MSVVNFVRRLVDAGFSFEDAMKAGAIFEEVASGRPEQPLTTLVKRLFEINAPNGVVCIAVAAMEQVLAETASARRTRVKAYGPASNPKTYWCPEKDRVLEVAAAFVPGPVADRLRPDLWLPLVDAVFRRDEYRCTYCGADGETYVLHCDHIAPISRGGSNDIENLTTACEWCNCSKRDRLPAEWLEAMR